MAQFSNKSFTILSSCHPDIQMVFQEAIMSSYFDFSVIEGYRSGYRQDCLYESGESKAKAGESAHNVVDEDLEPYSCGVDIVPYPSAYKDGQAMLLLAGHIISTAERLGIDITCGCDWDRDGMVMDTTFRDFWHFELTEWRSL